MATVPYLGFRHDAGARFLSCSRIALCLICSLRSLRCSPGSRRLRQIWRNGKALFRHLLLQIGGANLENPPIPTRAVSNTTAQ
jgi:hypothetical protein